MNPVRIACAMGFALALFSAGASANEVEGKIQSVNDGNQTFVVQGITFAVDGDTEYDDGAQNFGDLQSGQTVEVEFEYRNERHLAEEVEVRS